MLNRRLKLGTFFGIGLYIHWSFGLMIAWIALSASGDGPADVLYAVAQLLGVYLCVTLHEYGHVLAARRFSGAIMTCWASTFHVAGDDERFDISQFS